MVNNVHNASPTRLKRKQLAQNQWARFMDGMTRGHSDYQKQAKMNEDFYLGGGRQWDEETKKALEAMEKPWLEENIIFSTVNTILGTQTQSRMDIAYKPRDIGDQETSDILTKIGMFVVDQNKFPWKESQVFADGMIQQRGYFEIKMDFTDNFFGEVTIDSLDPLDVIPDPDAKEYDPDTWKDVIVTKWLPIDDIKEIYGTAKYKEVVQGFEALNGQEDWGSTSGDYGQERNKFGTSRLESPFFVDKANTEHVRLLERQYWKLTMRGFWFDPATGEAVPVPDNMKLSEAKKIARETGREFTKRLVKRVRWTVSSFDTILHDDWSPYENFTIVPFFPYFRRGVTVGMVDNLIKTQEMINKTFSQILHTVNTTANSGWIIEEDSLVNMDVVDLEDLGAKSGLLLEYKMGKAKPEKIQPNIIPTGLKDIMTTSIELVRLISGVSESFQGGRSNEVSGTAIQSRVQQAAVQLATPIDNLFRTRNMIADRLLKLIQAFYTEERVFLITSPSKDDEDKQVTINQTDQEGNVINDVTAGKYDIVIADVPTQITFENAQFAQALEMRKFGVAIPDEEMVLMSTLSRKQDIAKKVSGAPSEEEQQAQQEQQQLQIETLKKEIEKIESEAKNKENEAMKKAAEVAVMLKENPGLGAVIDRITQEEEDTEPAIEPATNEFQETLSGAFPEPQDQEIALPDQLTRLGGNT